MTGDEVLSAARREYEFAAADIIRGKTGDAADAVAAHLRLRTVGIEHAHAIDAVSVAHEDEQPVGTDARSAVARAHRKRIESDARHVAGDGVRHHEFVARTVALYEADFHTEKHIIVQNYK